MSRITRERAEVLARAIKDLIKAEIHEIDNTEPDSMGSYYEEKNLVEAILDATSET